jgi:3-keto-disaccharide hydrolase
MGSLWIFKKLVLISALIIATLTWSDKLKAASIYLTWEDTSADEDGFKIDRLVAGLVDTTLTVPANATSYTDSAVTAGTVYCYRVEAFNSAGDSVPSNQVCAMAAGAIANSSISASPATSTPGGTITAAWSGIAAPTTTDWIGLYSPGAADTNFLGWIYTSCSKTPGTILVSGSCSYSLPTTLSLGNYELRLFTNDGFTRLAASNSLAVAPTLTVSPTTVRAGATVTAGWSGITAPTPKDWIGLYALGAANTSFINWLYVSCSTVASTARASGSCSYFLPATLSAGNYELRLFANDGFTQLSATNSFTVTTGTTTAPALTASPKTVKAGGTLTATWSGISTPAPKDWIGLYAPGAADTKFINWVYVSCSKVAGSARASGSCSYVLPATISVGNYELRLFANDGFARLTTSNTLTVSTSSNSTSIVLANAISTGNGSSTGLLPQVSREWTDYDLKVNLRSMNNGSIGVMFRYQDDRNHYRFVWNQKSKFRRLEKIENGTVTVLANDAVGYVKGRTYQLQILAQGATLRVFIDGAQIFSVADSTFSEGTIGLYSSSNQASFDNIVAQDLNTGVVLLSQDFNDGIFHGWTIVDQGEHWAPSVWSATSGALLQSSAIDGTFALYTARAWSGYRFTGKLRSMDKGAIGVMFRYQDNQDYYRFAWDAQNKSRRLEKVQNGIVTTLAADAVPYVTGQTYNLEITTRGALLEVRIDGSAVFSVTDSSFDRGTIALYSQNNQGTIFDDIGVQDLITGAVLVSEDFNDGNFSGWTVIDKTGMSTWSVQSGSLVQNNKSGAIVTDNIIGVFALR